MNASTHPPAWKILLAFAIIYFVWGSTFLAIRVGVHEVPPFLLASLRFLGAGGALFVARIVQGDHFPSRKQWASLFFLAILLFVFDYGMLFWAEQRVPSGVAAIMMAIIPLFMTLSEIVILRTQRLTIRLGGALFLGICGVAVLMSRSVSLGGESIDGKGALALIFGGLSWSVASALTRKLPLPESKVMNSGAQMLSGGILLAFTAAGLGEFRNFHPGRVSAVAWFALLYLIVAGSIVAFTAYVWLLHYQSPTKVGTYAYVNPVVAVILGYFFGGEGLSLRTMMGAALILISVFVITTSRASVPIANVPAEDAA